MSYTSGLTYSGRTQDARWLADQMVMLGAQHVEVEIFDGPTLAVRLVVDRIPHAPPPAGGYLMDEVRRRHQDISEVTHSDEGQVTP